jgi:hypothetical protein
MGKVRRVYKLNLSVSLDLIPIGLVLEKVKPFVGDGFLYKLSYLSSSTYLSTVSHQIEPKEFL